MGSMIAQQGFCITKTLCHCRDLTIPLGFLAHSCCLNKECFHFPGYSSQPRIDREHSDTTVTSVYCDYNCQPTSVVSSGTRSTANSTQPIRAVQSGRRTPAAVVSD